MITVKKPSSATFFHHFRRAPRGLKACMAVLLSIGTGSTGLMAQGPAGPVVRAGDVHVTGEGTQTTTIQQLSDRAIIDWRSFGIGAADQVLFLQPSAKAATLNRVTGEQVSVILGRLDANGQVLLINPNGIVFGGGAQVNVGSLIASTANISNANFLSGQLVFDQPGRPGAGILNAGTMTARDGGLVALVAPHVRNDGVIVARLGTVMLGSADTFTVDLYGDALINLALSEANIGQLRDASGVPVTSLITNTGQIDTAGGRTVLMTARGAKNVLDNLINMSGTIKADTAVQQGGRILLLGEGGKVDVSGTLSAQGGAGATGGSIQVLGDTVHLAAGAALDVSGATGGGTIDVGGAFQGKGDTYRALQTTVDAGATLKADATTAGNGGNVVIWSDGQTQFAGAIDAKGGAAGGDGGHLEVSGKRTLDFLGQADASAAAGQAGSLLLDPAYLNIGVAEASTITRVLRTGTTTNLQADVDINVNSAIYPGDRDSGGGLNMTAGNNINVNDFIVTNDGAINMTAAQGTVNVAAGKAVFAGNAPITVSAGGTLHTGPMVTTGALSLQSVAGSVAVDAFIDDHTGPVTIKAAGAVDINQPIISLASGSPLNVTAGTDINVNAQVDGRGGAAGGAVTMNAARDLTVNQAIVTNNGAISLGAAGGALTVGSATPIVSGTGATRLNAGGNVTSGPISAGTLAITSSGGAVTVNGLVDSATGDTQIAAASDVNINAPIVNGQSGGALGVTAGRDININAAVDGRGGVAGGTVTMTAARNLNANDFVLTNNGAIGLTATGGTTTIASGKGTLAGNAAITLRAAGDLTTGLVSGGSLSATSSGGAVRVNGAIDGATGRVDLTAGTDVAINAPILNMRTGAPLNATAGRDVLVNAQIDGRGGATGGSVSLKAARDVAIANSVITNNGGIAVTATTGAATMAPGTALASGNGAIAIVAGGDVTTRGISGGSLSATSTNGSVSLAGLIDGSTGRVDLAARRDVNINAPVLNTRSGAPLTGSAGGDVNVNAQIDGTGGAAGGAVTLTAGQNLNVNAAIATHDGAIRLSSTNGASTVANTAGLFAGSAAIDLDALGQVTTGTLNGGAMRVASRGGSVLVSGPIAGTGGAMTIGAAGQVDIAHAITNPGTSSPLTVTGGTDINVNAPVGRTAAGVPSSAVTLVAGQNVHLNESLATEGGAIKVTATNGAVTTAASEGLFAGTGAVTVQSGQTLSTPIIGTTGAVTLRSTGGAVNVDAAIAGTTGAVTIDAATDVNVNQGIANPRADAPLLLTAGHDINVNAAIDGRDLVLTGPSGTTTLKAGNDIALNADVVTVDSALSLTAAAGTVNWGSGTGLFAGSGPISVTAGSTLDTGVTSTTGSLHLASTGADVNVNTPIDDTTGAVTIAAGSSVNINQAITNIKTGNSLTVNAGADINVLARVDGRNGAAAGGSVTMTAGQDLDLVKAITTNNGPVTLEATAGSITVPVGVQVIQPVFDATLNTNVNQITTPMEAIITTGSAPVSLTSGGDFTLASPVKTTGALSVTSTNGNVTIDAPITDDTGAVTITAGNALVVNNQIKSNDQDIVLNAGAGGITVNTIVDYDYTRLAAVNSRGGTLTLNSVGNVSIADDRGISSTDTVTIDTRGQILNGSIGDSVSNQRPQTVVLNADGGIATFAVGFTQSLQATSSGGSITLSVAAPSKVRITTGTPGTLDCPTCDINLSSTSFDRSIGPDVVLNAGGSVNLSNARTTTIDLTARSGDISLQEAFVNNTLTATAGRDVRLNNLLWLGSSPSQPPSGGPLAITAGRDIVTTANSPIHISNDQSLTFVANRNLTLFLLETLGAVSLTATTGNITLNNDIGPHIINGTPDLPFNNFDKGVASLVISAPASTATITMQGARAEGDVTISTGGDLTAAKQITSVNGTVTITVGGTQSIANVPIGDQAQLTYQPPVSPVIPPGPKSPLPSAPGAAANVAAGLPAFAEIAVGAADQVVGGVAQPGAASGGVGLPGAAGSAGAPARTGGVNGRPATPGGASVAQAGGSSDPGTADTASALRAAGASCGADDGANADTGLEAATQKPTTDASAPQNPSCGPAASAGQTAGATPAVAPSPVGAPAPAGTPAAPASPIGGHQ
jgi:filamentous hemagglutinin family protein